MSLLKYKAVIFDCGGVLVPNIDDNMHHLNKLFDCTQKEVIRTYFKHLHAFEKGRISKKEFWEFFNKRFDKRVPVEKIEKRLFKGIKMYPIMRRLLKALKKDYIIALLTNNTQWLYDLDKREDFLKYFSKKHVVSSHEVGMRKPELRIYRLMLKRLGLKPAEAVFIDDLYVNVKAAKKVGIEAIRCKSPEQVVRDLKKIGVLKKNV
ncbi:HAD family phosphatase [Candidatus Woesearchaeota archaeon]|nr:MAG: HAD family phosphatase [Candidatus Woesearchaeota archaeon]